MRARVFLRGEDGYSLACEIDAEDADDVWRQLEGDPDLAGRSLKQGDIVYISDVYLELDGDGGWGRILPGELTAELYRLIVDS